MSRRHNIGYNPANLQMIGVARWTFKAACS